MFDMAPSGLAMLLKRDWLENEVLESHIITESSMCNDVMSVKGGTKNPLTAEDVATEGWRINVTDPEGMKQRLGATSLQAFTGAVRGALKRSELTEQDVAWVCPVHINPKAHKAILTDLGLTEDHGAYLYDYGHCGHGDQLIGLEMGLQQGKVNDGSVVVFLGAGTGYAFSATAIRWGRRQ